jgi:ParB/RepB/Spo0J family partition protein
MAENPIGKGAGYPAPFRAEGNTRNHVKIAMTTFTEETTVNLDPKTVHISKLNTRQPTKADVTELIESIRHSRQITPAIVRPHPKKPGHYELAAGARRKVACGTLGIPLSAIVREIPDEEFEDMILTDNLQREDPDPMQEAILIERRIAAGAAPSEIAARYGKSDSWLRRRMKLMGLTATAREAWQPEGAFYHFTTEMMEFVGTLPAEEQDALADDSWAMKDFGTLRELLESHHRRARSLEKAEWLNDPCTFVEGCGPGCANNTADSLFPDEKHPCGSCLNVDCFLKRQSLFLDNAIAVAIGGRPITEFVILSGSQQREVTWKGESYRAIPEWQQKQGFTMLKKERKGAKPALDLTTPASPVIRWVIPKEATAIGEAITTEAAPRKESREDRLTGKRLALMNERLVAAVQEAEVPAAIPTLRIAAAFGMSRSRSYSSSRTYQNSWQAVDSADLVPDLDDYTERMVSPEVAVWAAVKPVLLGRLTFHRNSDLLDRFKRGDMERIASLIAFDYVREWESICTKEITVPKSWGSGFDPVTLEAKQATAA